MKRAVVTVLLLLVVALPSVGQGPVGESEATASSCTGSCRGLGIEKVKAGDEHCGLISRERKDKALDTACALSLDNRQELESTARERALEKCSDAGERKECRCDVEIRRWQNVYTHVLSQRCWTECGWAAMAVCGAAASGDTSGDGNES